MRSIAFSTVFYVVARRVLCGAATAFLGGTVACIVPPVDPAGRGCDATGACAPGFTCVEGACELACTVDDDCPDVRRCIAGACLAGIVDPPDAGVVDAGNDEDAGEPDAGEPDAGPNVAPTATSTSALVKGNVASLIEVPSADENRDALTVVVIAQPANGTAAAAAPAANGAPARLEYTPDDGFAGFDEIAVAVDDGELRSETVVVTVEVIGRSCAHVLNTNGSRGDGVYRADLSEDGSGDVADAVPVFCDMSTAGGGWTLALKVDGGSDEFCYDDPKWTDDVLFNGASVDNTLNEAKLAPFTSAPFDELLEVVDDLLNVDEPTAQLVMPFADPTIAGLSLSEVFALEQTIDSSLAEVAYEALFPTFANSIQQTTGPEGLNVEREPGVSGARIGQASALCTDYSLVGVGMFSETCGGTDLVSAGMRGDNCSAAEFGVPAFARVSLRSRDFTFLPPARTCDEHLVLGRSFSGLYLLDEAPGGAAAEITFCDNGDFRRLIAFDVDSSVSGQGDACPFPLVANASGPGCIRDTNDIGGPVSLFFESPISFTQVKVRVEAFAFGSNDSFLPAAVAGTTLDTVYVDGISVTAGEPRVHVFTLAVAGPAGSSRCQCNGGAADPAFVGNNQLCDDVGEPDPADPWNEDQPLFDFDVVNVLCQAVAQPTELNATIARSEGPVEVRVMTDQPQSDEDIAITRLEIFVK